MKKVIKLTESDLHNIIKESINDVLLETDFNKYHINDNPYDDKIEGNGQSQPIKNGVGLDEIRARLFDISNALINKDYEVVKKKVLRLYKLVDSMKNQGYYVVR